MKFNFKREGKMMKFSKVSLNCIVFTIVTYNVRLEALIDTVNTNSLTDVEKVLNNATKTMLKSTDRFQNNTLMIASLSGNLDIVNAILGAANLETRKIMLTQTDNLDENVLMLGVLSDEPKIVEVLLNAADLETKKIYCNKPA